MKNALSALLKGEVIALPTETVYALAADSENLSAIARIYALKKRPKNKALSLLIADLKAVKTFAHHIPQEAFSLMHAFWPGPLTLILPSFNQQSIALRMPSNAFVLSLIQQLSQQKGKIAALCAPSANLSGTFSPTLSEHVLADFGPSFLIVGGTCALGIESTIVDCTCEPFQIIRSGAILLKDLQKIIPNIQIKKNQNNENNNKTKSNQNYYLFSFNQIENFLNKHSNKKNIVLGFQQPQNTHCNWIQTQKNPKLYAQELYIHLRKIEHLQCDFVLLESPPQNEHWQAVWNIFHGQLKKIFNF